MRWRPHYDCSSFVITAYQNSGVPVKDNGMTYTRKIKITHSRSTARNTSAVGESSDNENRNQSAGEIEADDVKARQSMSKEERLNTFPESLKPNQNADVVFWENSKSNEYGDANIDEDMGIRYNDDIDIPYRKKTT